MAALFLLLMGFPRPINQQSYTAKQQSALRQNNEYRQRKSRIQYPQRQRVISKKAAVPEAQCLRQGKRHTRKRDSHPDIYQPRSDSSQQPAAAQSKYQRRNQCDYSRYKQFSPRIPSKISAVKYGGFHKAGERQQHGSHKSRAAACQRVPAGACLRCIGKNSRTARLGRREEGQEKQYPNPE